jgi:hypothetical protein
MLTSGIDNKRVPLVLLPFATMVVVTTLTCVVEALSWDVTREVKTGLMTLYLPYLGLCEYQDGYQATKADSRQATAMFIDMYCRIDGLLTKLGDRKPKKA